MSPLSKILAGTFASVAVAAVISSPASAQGVITQKNISMALAQTIAARAPIAAETAKTNLRAAYAVPLETAVQYERDLQTICFATEDAKEGRDAFKQKRMARFNRR